MGRNEAKELIQGAWTSKSDGGERKEILGGKSPFRWCCGMPMRRIYGFCRVMGKTYRLGNGLPFTVGWYCEVCEARRENDHGMM